MSGSDYVIPNTKDNNANNQQDCWLGPQNTGKKEQRKRQKRKGKGNRQKHNHDRESNAKRIDQSSHPQEDDNDNRRQARDGFIMDANGKHPTME